MKLTDLCLRWSDNQGRKKDGRGRIETEPPPRLAVTFPFFPHLPTKNPWYLLPLPSKCRKLLTYMLHSKRCHKDFQPQSTKSTPLPVTNGANSSFGCTSQTISEVSGNQYLSSRSSPSTCTPVFWKHEEAQPRKCLSNINLVSIGQIFSAVKASETRQKKLGNFDFRLG